MTKIISIINQKGGVGKTATAYNLAVCLGIADKKTLIIDLDPSANTSKGLSVNTDTGKTIDAVFHFKNYGLSSIIQFNEKYKNLDIIASSIRLAKAQKQLTSLSFRESFLKKLIDPLTDDYDFIIIDCCPTLGDLTINAIYAANFLLIPVRYEEDALEGTADLFDTINEINPEAQFKILRNGYDARKHIINQYLENSLISFFVKDFVFNTLIFQDEEINKAKMHKSSVIEFNPYCRAAKCYQQLAQEIINI